MNLFLLHGKTCVQFWHKDLRIAAPNSMSGHFENSGGRNWGEPKLLPAGVDLHPGHPDRKILLVLPLSAAQCERAISAQNRFKNCHRASLAPEITESLIRISAEGPPVVDYDPAPAVAAWFSSAKKPRRPFYTP